MKTRRCARPLAWALLLAAACAAAAHAETLNMAVVGNGSTAPSIGPNVFTSGETVFVSAFPDSGWRFDHWEGDLSGTVSSLLSVVMDTDKSITAVFVEQVPRALTVVVSGNGTTNPPAGVHGYVEGDVATLSATPDPGWAFDHWEGALAGSDPRNQFVTLSTDQTVTAVFSPQDFTLSIAIQGSGTASPAPGITGYLNGQTAHLEAFLVGLEWTFDHWEGDLTGNANPATLLMDGHKSVTAVFVTPASSFQLTTIAQGQGSVTPAGNTSHAPLDEVSVTAIPEAGWVLDRWEGALSGSENPTSLVMTGNSVVIAVFTEFVASYALTTTAMGQGSIDPPDTSAHAPGAQVVVTATPAPGWAFSEWTGAVFSTENPITLTMDADQALSAIFVELPPRSLTTSVTGQGAVSPEGQTTHANASEILVTATPQAGWVFSHWEGDLSGNENPTTITLDVDRAVTAVFTQITYALNTSVAAGNGTVEPAGETVHPALTTVQITAIPEEGWQFTGWQGDLSGTTNPIALLMDGLKSVSASFEQDPGEGEGLPVPPHSADQDGDFQVGLSELLRVIQFYNSSGYRCEAGTEDGYAPGPGDQSCPPHTSDYNTQDWAISLSELLRVIQFYNVGGYAACAEGEDGYCPGPATG